MLRKVTCPECGHTFILPPEKRKWTELLKLLFTYRYEMPCTQYELYNNHYKEIEEIGIKNIHSLYLTLNTPLLTHVYKFTEKSETGQCMPCYYAINRNGIDRLVAIGFIPKKDKITYQDEVAAIARSWYENHKDMLEPHVPIV